MLLVDTKSRTQLHREIRDENPDIWERACHHLGTIAATDQNAYETLCELLLSPHPELCLRGLVALRLVAPSKPDEVLAFLKDRIDEARVQHDPILLDATFFIFTALPNGLGQKTVSRYLEDPNEVIRSAAAAAVSFWPKWPPGTLTKLASDPSLSVRAGLLTALQELEDSADRRESLALLKAAAVPQLEALLNEALGVRPSAPPSPIQSTRLEEADLSALLSTANPLPVLVTRFARWLDESPEEGIEFVRSRLDEPGALALTEQLGGLCRDPELASLFTVWNRILGGLEHGFKREELLGIVGLLKRVSPAATHSPLQRFINACNGALECQSITDIVVWSCQQQLTEAVQVLWFGPSTSFLSVDATALETVETLAQWGRQFEELNLYQLSNLTDKLDDLRSTLSSSCPRPEFYPLELVVIEWQNLVHKALETLMGGGVPK